MRGKQNFSSGVSPKWVKSNKHRRKKEREESESQDNNGQYIRLNQNSLFADTPTMSRRCESVPDPSWLVRILFQEILKLIWIIQGLKFE